MAGQVSSVSYAYVTEDGEWEKEAHYRRTPSHVKDSWRCRCSQFRRHMLSGFTCMLCSRQKTNNEWWKNSKKVATLETGIGQEGQGLDFMMGSFAICLVGCVLQEFIHLSQYSKLYISDLYISVFINFI
jgi:hypothetical protein